MAVMIHGSTHNRILESEQAGSVIEDHGLLTSDGAIQDT